MRWVTLAILLLLPAAVAHGASPAREIDTRLVDDTAHALDYTGPDNMLPMEGLDILTLDVYEGTMPGSIEPAIAFRVTILGSTAGDHRIDITATAGAQPVTLDLSTSDLASYTSTQFELVRGPFDAGSDGHAKTIEGIISLANLGLSPGGQMTGIEATSYLDDEPQDVAPGTFFVAGQQVPAAPTDEIPDAPSYVLQGPANLFTASANASLVPVGKDTIVGLSFNSSLATLAQVLSLSVQAPEGINVSFSDTTVLLDADGSGAASLTISGVALGTVRILAESDLGVARMLSIALDGAGQIGAGGDVESADMLPGESFQYTFTEPGTFEYHCHPHPWMVASITINARQNGTSPQTHVVKFIEPSSKAAEWQFDPEQITIQAGDTVVWVNEGTVVHTIMGSTGIGAGGHGHDHADHDHGTDGGKDTPVPMVLGPVALALALAMRRRC